MRAFEQAAYFARVVFLASSKDEVHFRNLVEASGRLLPRQLPLHSVVRWDFKQKIVVGFTAQWRGASSIIEPKQERGAAFLFALPRWRQDRWVLCLEIRPCGERITTLKGGREAGNNRRGWEKLGSDVKQVDKVNHSGDTTRVGRENVSKSKFDLILIRCRSMEMLHLQSPLVLESK